MPLPDVSNTTAPPCVLLSAFADEAANRKTAARTTLRDLAAIGLRHYSPRFVDVDGIGDRQARGRPRPDQLKDFKPSTPNTAFASRASGTVWAR